MKLGFTLKKTKKPALQQQAAAAGGAGSAFATALPTKRVVEKVFVTDFDPLAPPAVEFDADGNAKRTLVIPLIKTNAWSGVASDDASALHATATAAATSAPQQQQETTTPLTADERAARELLADAQAHADGTSVSTTSSTLVIPLSSTAATASVPSPPHNNSSNNNHTEDDDATARYRKEMQHKLFNFEHQTAKKQRLDGSPTSRKAPILQQNVVPGMDALADASDKFRLDVSLRPEALDVHSDAYALVPIEDFGAALLRGMGWKGDSTKDDSTDKTAEPKPRHKLLGLGATARPPMPGDKNNRHKQRRSGTTSSDVKRDDQPMKRAPGLNSDAAAPHSSQRSSSRREESDERRRPSSSSSDRRRDDDDARRRERTSDRRDDRRSRSRSRKRSRDDRRERSDNRDDRRRPSRSRDDDDRSRDRNRSSRR